MLFFNDNGQICQIDVDIQRILQRQINPKGFWKLWISIFMQVFLWDIALPLTVALPILCRPSLPRVSQNSFQVSSCASHTDRSPPTESPGTRSLVCRGMQNGTGSFMSDKSS